MKLKKNKGLTLIEIMLAITILLMAIIPLMKMLGDSLRGAQTFSDISIATQLAQDLMEEIKSRRWDENTPADGSETTVYSFPLGPDGGEPPYDDIDDYHNATTPYDIVDGKYTRSVSVTYVNVPDAGAITPVAGTSDFKRIDITVEWPNNKPLQMSTVRANYWRY